MSLYDTKTATVLGVQPRPSPEGFIETLYRGLEGNYYLIGRPVEQIPSYRVSALINSDRINAIIYLMDWGLHEAITKHFGEGPGGQASAEKFDPGKATLLFSSGKTNGYGYRHNIYRSEGGRFYLEGILAEPDKLPPAAGREKRWCIPMGESDVKELFKWNRRPDLIEKMSPGKSESKPSITILKSGPIPGADRRENAGGGPPDPGKAAGKVSGGISPGLAGKGPDQKAENPVSQGENRGNEGQTSSKQDDSPAKEGPLVKNARHRAGIRENDQVKTGEIPEGGVENAMVRNAIKRTKAPGSVSVHDIRDDEGPLVKDAFHRRGTGENARGHGGEIPEGTGENHVLRDAERRSGIGGAFPSTDGGNPLVRDAIRRTRAEGSDPAEDEKKPEETGDEKKPEESEGEKEPEKDDEANQDQGEKESEKTDQAASGEEDKDPEKAEEGAVVRDAMRRRERMIGEDPIPSGSGEAA
ncbi:MAG TPA: hypothetical protein PLE04_06445 [Syntrophales bacterium]|nr:hypothetical protein [Syntrophales bacterium]